MQVSIGTSPVPVAEGEAEPFPPVGAPVRLPEPDGPDEPDEEEEEGVPDDDPEPDAEAWSAEDDSPAGWIAPAAALCTAAPA